MSKQKTTIGDNIRKYRNKLGISQDILSKRANLAFHTIAKIEAGSTPDPRIETVKKIADALGVTLDDLIHPVR
jgi:XRE family transcriptional regulator of biofilm formation